MMSQCVLFLCSILYQCTTNALINNTKGYIITTQIDDYIIYANEEYVDEVFEDISNEVKIINDVIHKAYTESIIERLNIKKIIVIGESHTFAGYHLPNGILVFTLNSLRHDPEFVIHHEIMHQIDSEMATLRNDSEWDKLNKFGYVANYEEENRRQGFVAQYGMKKMAEDKATIYTEFMTRKFSKRENGLYYDPIIIAKFKLLFERLITFHTDFSKIVKTRNNEENFIFPSIVNNNKISIKFKDTDAYGYGYTNNRVDQHKIILLNVGSIYANYKTILPDNIKNLFEKLLPMIRNRSSETQSVEHMYPDKVCLFQTMSHILYLITYYGIKYDISIDIPENKPTYEEISRRVRHDGLRKLSGMITLYY